MNNCKDCKHWKKEHEDNYGGYYATVGLCKRTPQYWDATGWHNYGDRTVIKDEYKDRLAFVEDGSDYSAALLTKAEFGCVMWEGAKERESKRT